MNTKHIFTALCATALFAMGTASCSSDEALPQEGTTNDKTLHTCKLVFEGDIEKFDADTRAASWADKDTIFLQFNAGENKFVEGRAVYNVSSGNWFLSYYGDLPDASSTCKAYHFKEGLSSDLYDTELTFSGISAVYGDTIATYSKSGNDVKVKAQLKPFTGRMRFKGEPGSKFTLHGIRRYMTFNIEKGEFIFGHTAEALLVGSDGYTPYVYGTLPADRRHLWVAYDDVAFMADCPNNILMDGKSGSMAVPTEQAYSGWKRRLDKVFTYNGAFFVMKYVQGGTFMMGATVEQTEASDNEKPAHEVTLSDYYIGETEVTCVLWDVVMNPSKNISNQELTPMNGVNWNNCIEFSQRLSTLLGETFSLPTEAQWEYAARGGCLSKGYKYSGSSVIDEVAWYAENSYINGTRHKHTVATKAPNELGIYDMSGNIMEYCSDLYGAYESAAVTNPTGPTSGNSICCRGGHLDVYAYDCRVSSRSRVTKTNTSNFFGCRLVLTPQQ